MDRGRRDGSASQVFRETLDLFQPMHCRPGFLSDNSIFTYQGHARLQALGDRGFQPCLGIRYIFHLPENSHIIPPFRSHQEPSVLFFNIHAKPARLNHKYTAVAVFPPHIRLSSDIVPHFEIQQVGSLIGVPKTHTNPVESTTNHHQPPSPTHINLSSLPNPTQRLLRGSLSAPKG